MNRPKREFHFEDGKSDKFWTIALQGDAHILDWGRSGTVGQHLEKHFESVYRAQWEYDKIIKEKIKKGYKEVAAKKPTKVPAHIKQENTISENELVCGGFYADVKGMVYEILGFGYGPSGIFGHKKTVEYKIYNGEGKLLGKSEIDLDFFLKSVYRRVKPRG